MWLALWKFIVSFVTAPSEFSVMLVRDDLQTAMSWIYTSDSNHHYFEELYSVFAAPALALLLVYFSMDLFDKLSSENFTLDTLILDFAKIIAGVALINNGIYIAQGLYGISEWTCDLIQTATESSPALNFTTIVASGNISSIWDIIVALINGLLSGQSYIEMIGIALAEQVCISIIAYQRAVRLGMRIIVSPLVMADVVGHGLNNSAMHYLRTIFALCMEGPIICLSVAFIPIAKTTPSGITIPFLGITLAFIIVKLMFDAHKIAKDIFV